MLEIPPHVGRSPPSSAGGFLQGSITGSPGSYHPTINCRLDMKLEVGRHNEIQRVLANLFPDLDVAV